VIGQKIKRLRKEFNITQKELGEELGVTTSMIGMYETNARKPSYEILEKLSNFFQASTDYLMSDIPFKNKIEAQHSISIAVVKEIKENLDYYLEILEPYEGIDLLKSKGIQEEVITYCDSIIDKFYKNDDLSYIELFELSNLIFKSIKWSPDYDGKIYLEDYMAITLLLELNLNEIEKITLDLSESYLLKITKSDHFYLEQSPNLLKTSTSMTEYTKNEENQNTDIDSKYQSIINILKDKNLNEEEIEELKNYINYLLSKR